MKLTTLRLSGDRTAAARVEGERAVLLEGFSDVGDVLRRGALDEVVSATGEELALAGTELAPLIPAPGKIICVGLNYRTHILEMGRELPAHPTLFAKFAESLIGPTDPVVIPPESEAVDWEAELAVVIGRPVRRARGAAALDAIAGYSLLNDVTMRDFQYRTPQWLQGKTWERSTPFGPVLVTPEELPDDAELTAAVDGEVVQRTTLDDLVFSPAELVEYISTIITLQPGDVIATGTPGGVGHARDPRRYLTPGQTLTTTLTGVGSLENLAVAEGPGTSSPGLAS